MAAARRLVLAPDLLDRVRTAHSVYALLVSPSFASERPAGGSCVDRPWRSGSLRRTRRAVSALERAYDRSQGLLNGNLIAAHFAAALREVISARRTGGSPHQTRLIEYDRDPEADRSD